VILTVMSVTVVSDFHTR